MLVAGFGIDNPDEGLRHDGPQVQVDNRRNLLGLREILFPVVDDLDLRIASVGVRRVGFCQGTNEEKMAEKKGMRREHWLLSSQRICKKHFLCWAPR